MENLKAKTWQQLAAEYGICVKTFKKWLHKEGIVLDNGLINPATQLFIYQRIGVPIVAQKFPKVPTYSY